MSNKERIENAIKQNQQNEAFIYACECGEIEMVKDLLARPEVDPATDDNRGFILACQNNHLAVVQLLLTENRIDPKADNCFAFKYCCQEGKTELVTLLLPLMDPKTRQSGAKLARKKGFENVANLVDPQLEPVTDGTKARIQSQNGWAKPTGEWMQGNASNAGRGR
jgi:hypothetical protein